MVAALIPINTREVSVWILWRSILTLVVLAACTESDDGTEGARRNVLDDPLAPHAWYLKNTGQRSFAHSGGVAGMDPGISTVHVKGYSGEGVRIAVSDSGAEADHEDLYDNILYDELRNYNLESPWLGNSGDANGHGTSVAGLIGARAGNLKGSYGVAYNARIAAFFYVGIEQDTTAKEIDQANGNFDIFNYSYGYSHCRYTAHRDGYIEQLEYGVEKLRNGKGAIYVKAAGNNWKKLLSKCTKDTAPTNPGPTDYYYGNSALDAFHNWPYQIVVGGYSAEGKKTSYSSPGSVLWVSAPGGEAGSDGTTYSLTLNPAHLQTPAMLTTDLSGCDRGYSQFSLGLDSEIGVNTFDKGPMENFAGSGDLNPACKYTAGFLGTSAAVPVASGIIALILEANPDLTWRDVKYILAKTAMQLDQDIKDLDHPESSLGLSSHVYMPKWVTNTAGFKFHNYYGFGGINAKGAVDMAENYSSELGDFMESSWTGSTTLTAAIPDHSATGVGHTLTVATDVTIEAIQIELAVTHPKVSDLGVELTSPGGTKSVILAINSNIEGEDIDSWILSSNAFYGEDSQGDWTIKLIDGASSNTGTLTGWKIKFFGY